MKIITVLAVLVLAGYLALHYTPAGKRAQERMQQKATTQGTVSSSDRKFSGKSKDELQFELKFREEVVAAIRGAGDGKPVTVAACGMTRTATITPETQAQLAELEAEIRSIKAALATRSRDGK